MINKPLALIVLADADLAVILPEAWKAAGFEIEVLHDGGQGLARLEELVPDAVVLGYHLPRVTGDEIFRRVHADARFQNTYFVIISSHPGAQDLADYSDRVTVLLAPVSFSQMREFATRIAGNLPLNAFVR
jgi:DNA-binding response OmpR family regulator